MKRGLSFYGLIFGCVLFFTGCGIKSSNNSLILECSSKETVRSTLTEQVYKLYFDNEKVSKLSVDLNVSLLDADEKTRDNLEDDVNNAFGSYKNRKGISYSANIKDDGFVVKMDIYYDKLNDDDKAIITMINPENSYDNIKEELENSGFSCK